MKTVTIGFSHSTNIFSKLIMWATRSKISHTYIRDGEVVFQASGLKVNETTYRYFLTYETVIDEMQFVLTDEQWEAGETFRKNSLGKPYSWREIVGFLWVMMVKSATGRVVQNPLSDKDKAFVCVSLVCKYIGVDDEAENINPDELHKLLTRS